MKNRLALAALWLGAALVTAGNLPAAAATDAQLQTELERLPRLGTIAYITAHPDDESAATITYLARGLHARVVILCMTRGEGGQDVTGPQLSEELGDVRTRELKRAAAGYGAEVHFLGALDFGYSKSVEETFRIWGKDKMTEALVRELRALRPLAVISSWRGTPADGSAHHEATGILAREAFALMGNPLAFPGQFAEGLEPWQPRYFLVRARSSEGENAELTFEVPVDQPSPVPGKTYKELGWEAFQSHRSQGMHLIQTPRNWPQYLRVEATLRNGPPAPTSADALSPDLSALPDLYPTVGVLAAWRDRLQQVSGLAAEAEQKREAGKSNEAALALVQAAGLLAALQREIPEETTEPEPSSVRLLLGDRIHDFLQAAADVAGVRFDAFTDRAAITPGEQVWVGLAVRVADPTAFPYTGFKFGDLQLQTPAGWHVEPLAAEKTAEVQRAEYLVSVPENLDPGEAPALPLQARALLTTGSMQLEMEKPVSGLSGPPAEGGGLLKRFDPRRLLGLKEEPEAKGRLEPMRVAPGVTLQAKPALYLLPSSPEEMVREWCIELTPHRPQLGKISAWFEVPVGWYTPVPRTVELEEPERQSSACMSVTLPAGIPPRRYQLEAEAGRDIQRYTLSRVARYAGTDDATYLYQPADSNLQVLDIQVPSALRVGYIGFDDDPVPALLSQLGVAVDLLDERALARNNLGEYDAIVVATRAYDYRTDLADATPRLLAYVSEGGTLLVEHQGRRWDPATYAPYPGEKPAGLRVTDETAPVKMLAPENPVLSFPNRIGEADWRGWVQERGLYFWKSWAKEYTPLLEMADPGEEPLQGSLLAAHYGKGTYIYCGLALFRQVRAGIPGGVRLYINLLSQSRVPTTPAAPADSSQ
jgi:LmbE family N-acetylglucosaminyl deacetylase